MLKAVSALVILTGGSCSHLSSFLPPIYTYNNTCIYKCEILLPQFISDVWILLWKEEIWKTFILESRFQSSSFVGDAKICFGPFYGGTKITVGFPRNVSLLISAVIGYANIPHCVIDFMINHAIDCIIDTKWNTVYRKSFLRFIILAKDTADYYTF